MLACLTLFLTSGLVHLYNLDESICILGVTCEYFTFTVFRKQTVKTLVRCHNLWHLNWVCTVCICPLNGYLDKKVLNRSLFGSPFACHLAIVDRLYNDTLKSDYHRKVCKKFLSFVMYVV